MRLWMISRRTLQMTVVVVGLITLIGASVYLSEDPNASTLSYGVASKIIVIDPGHGGTDSGAKGRTLETPEKVITLDISRRLARTLGQGGAMVMMTRTTDADLSDEGFKGSLLERKRQDLARRVEKAHCLNADMYISIHTNADPSPRWHGAQTFYHCNSTQSRKLANCIQSEMVNVLGNNNRKAKDGVYFVMEKTKMPAVIVEVGFISNPEEERMLNDELYQSKVAYAIYSGIVKYCIEEDKP